MLFAEGAVSRLCERFIGLRIEAELAFVLKAPLAGAHLTIEDVIAATEYVSPALEILDTRIFRVDPETKRTRTVLDTISDNAANAGIVMGGTRLEPRGVDLRWIGAIVAKNGEIEETGLAAGVLGHPAQGIVWLAARFAEHGKSLQRWRNRARRLVHPPDGSRARRRDCRRLWSPWRGHRSTSPDQGEQQSGGLNG